jgi:cell division protein FtsL
MEKEKLNEQEQKFIENRRHSTSRLYFVLMVLMIMAAILLVIYCYQAGNTIMLAFSAMLLFTPTAILGRMLSDKKWLTIIDKLTK